MSYAHRCGQCDGEPGWEIVREGDVVVSWACDEHLASECDALQRDSEVTRLVVTHWGKRAEVAAINRMIRSAFDGEHEHQESGLTWSDG